MPEARRGEAASRSITNVGWGLLLVWVGTTLLLSWGWGVGLVGAGTIVLALQVWRRYVGATVEGSALLLGVVLLVCGGWTLFDVRIELLPLVCIAAGIALLASPWVSSGPRARGKGRDLEAPSHPRA